MLEWEVKSVLECGAIQCLRGHSGPLGICEENLTPMATARQSNQNVDMSLRNLLVDVHSHLYLPRYASLLRSRSNVPRIFTRNTPSGQSEDRLLILGDERSGGRPVGPQVRCYRLSDFQGCVRGKR